MTIKSWAEDLVIPDDDQGEIVLPFHFKNGSLSYDGDIFAASLGSSIAVTPIVIDDEDDTPLTISNFKPQQSTGVDKERANITDVKFARHHATKYHLSYALGSNLCIADIGSATSISPREICSVRAHPLGVSCTDWSPVNPMYVAASGVNYGVGVWDIRVPMLRSRESQTPNIVVGSHSAASALRTPRMLWTASTAAPTSQLSWCRSDGCLLAVSSGSQLDANGRPPSTRSASSIVSLWDIRAPSHPFWLMPCRGYVSSLDWSYTCRSQLLVAFAARKVGSSNSSNSTNLNAVTSNTATTSINTNSCNSSQGGEYCLDVDIQVVNWQDVSCKFAAVRRETKSLPFAAFVPEADMFVVGASGFVSSPNVSSKGLNDDSIVKLLSEEDLNNTRNNQQLQLKRSLVSEVTLYSACEDMNGNSTSLNSNNSNPSFQSPPIISSNSIPLSSMSAGRTISRDGNKVLQGLFITHNSLKNNKVDCSSNDTKELLYPCVRLVSVLRPTKSFLLLSSENNPNAPTINNNNSGNILPSLNNLNNNTIDGNNNNIINNNNTANNNNNSNKSNNETIISVTDIFSRSSPPSQNALSALSSLANSSVSGPDPVLLVARVWAGLSRNISSLLAEPPVGFLGLSVFNLNKDVQWVECKEPAILNGLSPLVVAARSDITLPPDVTESSVLSVCRLIFVVGILVRPNLKKDKNDKFDSVEADTKGNKNKINEKTTQSPQKNSKTEINQSRLEIIRIACDHILYFPSDISLDRSLISVSHSVATSVLETKRTFDMDQLIARKRILSREKWKLTTALMRKRNRKKVDNVIDDDDNTLIDSEHSSLFSSSDIEELNDFDDNNVKENSNPGSNNNKQSSAKIGVDLMDIEDCLALDIEEVFSMKSPASSFRSSDAPFLHQQEQSGIVPDSDQNIDNFRFHAPSHITSGLLAASIPDNFNNYSSSSESKFDPRTLDFIFSLPAPSLLTDGSSLKPSSGTDSLIKSLSSFISVLKRIPESTSVLPVPPLPDGLPLETALLLSPTLSVSVTPLLPPLPSNIASTNNNNQQQQQQQLQQNQQSMVSALNQVVPQQIINNNSDTSPIVTSLSTNLEASHIQKSQSPPPVTLIQTPISSSPLSFCPKFAGAKFFGPFDKLLHFDSVRGFERVVSYLTGGTSAPTGAISNNTQQMQYSGSIAINGGSGFSILYNGLHNISNNNLNNSIQQIPPVIENPSSNRLAMKNTTLNDYYRLLSHFEGSMGSAGIPPNSANNSRFASANNNNVKRLDINEGHFANEHDDPEREGVDASDAMELYFGDETMGVDARDATELDLFDAMSPMGSKKANHVSYLPLHDHANDGKNNSSLFRNGSKQNLPNQTSKIFSVMSGNNSFQSLNIHGNNSSNNIQSNTHRHQGSAEGMCIISTASILSNRLLIDARISIQPFIVAPAIKAFSSATKHISNFDPSPDFILPPNSCKQYNSSSVRTPTFRMRAGSEKPNSLIDTGRMYHHLNDKSAQTTINGLNSSVHSVGDRNEILTLLGSIPYASGSAAYYFDKAREGEKMVACRDLHHATNIVGGPVSPLKTRRDFQLVGNDYSPNSSAGKNEGGGPAQVGNLFSELIYPNYNQDSHPDYRNDFENNNIDSMMPEESSNVFARNANLLRKLDQPFAASIFSRIGSLLSSLESARATSHLSQNTCNSLYSLLASHSTEVGSSIVNNPFSGNIKHNIDQNNNSLCNGFKDNLSFPNNPNKQRDSTFGSHISNTNNSSISLSTKMCGVQLITAQPPSRGIRDILASSSSFSSLSSIKLQNKQHASSSRASSQQHQRFKLALRPCWPPPSSVIAPLSSSSSYFLTTSSINYPFFFPPPAASAALSLATSFASLPANSHFDETLPRLTIDRGLSLTNTSNFDAYKPYILAITRRSIEALLLQSIAEPCALGLLVVCTFTIVCDGGVLPLADITFPTNKSSGGLKAAKSESISKAYYHRSSPDFSEAHSFNTSNDIIMSKQLYRGFDETNGAKSLNIPSHAITSSSITSNHYDSSFNNNINNNITANNSINNNIININLSLPINQNLSDTADLHHTPKTPITNPVDAEVFPSTSNTVSPPNIANHVANPNLLGAAPKRFGAHHAPSSSGTLLLTNFSNSRRPALQLQSKWLQPPNFLHDRPSHGVETTAIPENAVVAMQDVDDKKPNKGLHLDDDGSTKSNTNSSNNSSTTQYTSWLSTSTEPSLIVLHGIDRHIQAGTTFSKFSFKQVLSSVRKDISGERNVRVSAETLSTFEALPESLERLSMIEEAIELFRSRLFSVGRYSDAAICSKAQLWVRAKSNYLYEDSLDSMLHQHQALLAKKNTPNPNLAANELESDSIQNDNKICFYPRIPDRKWMLEAQKELNSLPPHGVKQDSNTSHITQPTENTAKLCDLHQHLVQESASKQNISGNTTSACASCQVPISGRLLICSSCRSVLHPKHVKELRVYSRLTASSLGATDVLQWCDHCGRGRLDSDIMV